MLTVWIKDFFKALSVLKKYTLFSKKA